MAATICCTDSDRPGLWRLKLMYRYGCRVIVLSPYTRNDFGIPRVLEHSCSAEYRDDHDKQQGTDAEKKLGQKSWPFLPANPHLGGYCGPAPCQALGVATRLS